MIGKITNFLVKADYFVAELDNGKIRIGLAEVSALDIPESHPLFSKAKSASSADDAEELFDTLVENGNITIHAV